MKSSLETSNCGALAAVACWMLFSALICFPARAATFYVDQLTDDAAAECPAHDQRGAPRPQDGDGDGVAACDAGAYELGTPNGLASVPTLGSLGLLLLAGGLAALALRRLG